MFLLMNRRLEEDRIKILTIGVRCYDKKALTKDEKSFILQAYYRATGERLTNGCSNCFAKVFQYFNSINFKQMTEMRFRLKEGKKIMLHGMGDVLTNANLTNEKAIRILKRTPAAIKFFDFYPNDWRQICGVTEQAAPVSVPADPAPVESSFSFQPDKAVPADQAVPADKSSDATSGLDLETIRRNNLEGKTLKELKNIASNLELEEAYSGLNKADLIEFLLKQTA